MVSFNNKSTTEGIIRLWTIAHMLHVGGLWSNYFYVTHGHIIFIMWPVIISFSLLYDLWSYHFYSYVTCGQPIFTVTWPVVKPFLLLRDLWSNHVYCYVALWLYQNVANDCCESVRVCMDNFWKEKYKPCIWFQKSVLFIPADFWERLSTDMTFKYNVCVLNQYRVLKSLYEHGFHCLYWWWNSLLSWSNNFWCECFCDRGFYIGGGSRCCKNNNNK